MDEKTYTIRVLPAFITEMQAIMHYISNDLRNPQAAERLMSEVRRAIEKRSKAPEAFEPYHSKKERRYPYYRIQIGNYLILYVVIDDVMEVRRMIYQRRNWKNMI